MRSRRAAAIDIGTNSVKLIVAERAGDGIKTLWERSRVVGLGRGMDGRGEISEAAVSRTAAALSAFAGEAVGHGADEIRAVATHAVREAANAREFIERVRLASGLKVEVIPESEEAFLSYTAARLAAPGGGAIVSFDVGGGSTEIIAGRGGRPEVWRGAPLGALSLHERETSQNDPPGAESAERARANSLHLLKECGADEAVHAASEGGFCLIGIGGTVSCIAWSLRGLEGRARREADGIAVTAADIGGLIDRMFSMTCEERKKMKGLPEDRADVAPAGAVIVESIMKISGKDRFTVSLRGLRHGLIADMLLKG